MSTLDFLCVKNRGFSSTRFNLTQFAEPKNYTAFEVLLHLGLDDWGSLYTFASCFVLSKSTTTFLNKLFVFIFLVFDDELG